MSRIGKLLIKVPNTVTVALTDENIIITGPKGTLTRKLPRVISVTKTEEGLLKVSVKKSTNESKKIHGTERALIANMVAGVSVGWSKTLEMVGSGYRGESSGDTLTLSIGYSHPIKIVAPAGITFKVEKTDITIDGIDKEMVGQIAAKIRAIRPPEPYKGKGIKYKDEVVRRKAGKAAKTAGAPA